jgi:dipeptidyl aminopeptidase/acylaminoacyl peptidase
MLIRKIAISISALLFAAYLLTSWVFSSMIILPPADDGDGPRGERGNQERQQSTSRIELPPPEAIKIEAGDVTLDGAFYENPEPSDLAVILLPGRSGTRSGGLRLAAPFWESGYHVLVYDLRAAGKSGGSFQTFGFLDRHDASSAVDWLHENKGLDPSRIGIAGGSYGAAVAIQTLAVRDDLYFVIADSPFSDLRTVVNDYGRRIVGPFISFISPGAIWLAESRAGIDADDVSPMRIAQGKATPILLIHGVEDKQTSSDHSKRIHATADSENVRLILTDWGTGHVSSIRHDYKKYKEMVLGFISEYAKDVN